ncbi:flagellar hook-basal body complex protein [Neiella sp. HB171785]|uniref:Flagellar hook-basal body complex protein n=1 Tax=Neiella litorisoli TaxID=2771431 RepID=A0A8J6QJ34_9GAMM|nr:flagellar hook-basal body complex protein [Neiella litorisoli]MBD1389051.1 flagellar hook-basal body complex protein [Neiella litorisoli]
MQKGILAAAICLSLCACGGSNSSNATSAEGTAFELVSHGADDYFTLTDIAPSEQTPTNVATIYYAQSISVSFDDDGYLRTPQNYYVLSAPTNADGSVISENLTTAKAVQVDFDGDSSAKATSLLSVGVNLPPDAVPEEHLFGKPSSCGFDPDGYNASFSTHVYDSLGEGHQVALYFAKEIEETSTWQMRAVMDCMEMTPVEAQVLDFNESGDLDIDDADRDGMVTTGAAAFEYQGISFDNGADEMLLTIDVSAIIARFGVFEVSKISQDGSPFNQYETMEIHSDGLIQLRRDGGTWPFIGQLLMAGFQYPEHLSEVSEGVWMRTESSGQFHHYGGGNIQPVTYSE